MGQSCTKDQRAINPELGPPPVVTTMYTNHKSLLTDAGLASTGAAAGLWGGAISKDDTLLVIDMQNDFLPADVAPQGGRFGVAEGGSTIAPICDLIMRFHQAGALIVATRDYHPHDHCSFNCHGGPFPPHCVQGSAGSHFEPLIGKMLHTTMKKPPSKVANEEAEQPIVRGRSFSTSAEKLDVPQNPGRVEVAFKGFAEKVESYGGFKYKKEFFEERAGRGNPHCAWDIENSPAGITCAESWTGSFCLKCSSLMEDINAPPDVMAIRHLDTRPLENVVKSRKGRVLVVGLALDVCVTDTAVNAAQTGYQNVFIALDACRAAHVPGFGTFGDGYLADPEWLVNTWKNNKIAVIESSAILGDTTRTTE